MSEATCELTDEELRAIDAEVHEKVFGRPAVRVSGFDVSGARCWYWFERDEPEAPRIPSYSTRIASARLVVEKMRGAGLPVTIETAPLAICRAALKAIAEAGT